MTVAAVAYTPEGGTSRQLYAYNVQMHDARDAVGDVATLQCEGLEAIGKGDVAVSLGPATARLEKTYEVASHSYRHFPNETQVGCRTTADFAPLRRNLLRSLNTLETTGVPLPVVTRLAAAANISSQAATLQTYIREAAFTANTYADMAKLFERLGVFVSDGGLSTLAETSGSLDVPELSLNSLSIDYPNETETPRELYSSVVLTGSYNDYPDRAEVESEYRRTANANVRVATSLKFGSQAKFNNLMAVEWLRRLNNSARMTFEVDDVPHLPRTGQRIDYTSLPDEVTAVTSWGANDFEAWVVRSVDHRWQGQGLASPTNANEGAWTATVTAVPTIAT